jgi:hypothetical protein
VIESHFLILLVFSALVSAVFAALQRQGLKEQVRFGLLTFGAFVGSTIVLGWIMAPFPH